MKKQEFLDKYLEVTKDITGNDFYSCHVIEAMNEHISADYSYYMGSVVIGAHNYCNVADFEGTDRIIALELFKNIVITEKLYENY
tara:strand:+ start:1093 stop:1347 length:255 start_codon:yes stop_codon:yes gene_type:complete